MFTLHSLCAFRRVAFLPLLFSTAVVAQTPAPSPPPAAARRGPQAAPVISPEIAGDRKVTFRLRAPSAKAVTVSGQMTRGATTLVKDASGLWSATVGPLEPGIYEYSLNVDGIAMIDPGNRDIKPMGAPRTSILEIPGEPALLHDFQNVPHGRVSLHWYNSKSLGRRRTMQVYTPPGYEADATARFPTLYLFHGSGDNEATWVAHGHAHWILDNLIAQQRAKPMIVVMLDGHAVPPGPNTVRNANTAAFERDLLEDAMPLVVAGYRTRENAASRAIVGLSMGGGQSLTIGLKHPDQFAWVGGMSSSVANGASLITDPAALNRQLKLLWFACGKDDALIKANQDFDAALTAQKVKHEFTTTEGNHSWPVWRRFLADFAPRIF
ncbi:MAG: alpha/beta hydrolase-fold protein [Opitutaceae bacterium]